MDGVGPEYSMRSQTLEKNRRISAWPVIVVSHCTVYCTVCIGGATESAIPRLHGVHSGVYVHPNIMIASAMGAWSKRGFSRGQRNPLNGHLPPSIDHARRAHSTRVAIHEGFTRKQGGQANSVLSSYADSIGRDEGGAYSSNHCTFISFDCGIRAGPRLQRSPLQLMRDKTSGPSLGQVKNATAKKKALGQIRIQSRHQSAHVTRMASHWKMERSGPSLASDWFRARVTRGDVVRRNDCPTAMSAQSQAGDLSMTTACPVRAFLRRKLPCWSASSPPGVNTICAGQQERISSQARSRAWIDL